MTQWTLYTDDTPIGILSAKESRTNSRIFKSGTPLQDVLKGTYTGVIVAGNFLVDEETSKLSDSFPPYLYLAAYPSKFLQAKSYSNKETNWLRLYKLLRSNNLIDNSFGQLYKAYNDFVLQLDDNYSVTYAGFHLTDHLLIASKAYRYADKVEYNSPVVRELMEEKEDYISKKLARRYQFTKGDLQVSVVKADMYMHEIALRCQIDSAKLGYKNAVFVQNGNFVVVHKSPEVNIMDSLGIDNLEQVGNTYSFFMDNLEDYTLAEALRSTLNEA